VAYVHFTMIRLATSTIYGENMLARHVPGAESFMAMMDERPHVRRTMAERAMANGEFIELNVAYEG